VLPKKARMRTNFRRKRRYAVCSGSEEMPHTGTRVTSIASALDRLGRFEPVPLPVISLYVDLRADDRGQHNFMPVVK
jgi:hypothetical protein